MIRLFHLVWGHTLRQLLETLGWRSFLITLVINQSITPLLGLAVWSAAAPGMAITTYYVAILAVQMLTVSYEHHTLANAIYAGDISHELLRPQPVIVVTLGMNLALRIWHFLFALPVMILIILLSTVRFQPSDLLIALPALVMAMLVRFLFTYLLALAAFWTQQAHGVVGFGETLLFLLGGIAAPIALFPEAWRQLGVALPFRAMLGFPAEIAAGGLSRDQILIGFLWQLTWLIVFGLIAMRIWHMGLRRYTVVGG